LRQRVHSMQCRVRHHCAASAHSARRRPASAVIWPLFEPPLTAAHSLYHLFFMSNQEAPLKKSNAKKARTEEEEDNNGGEADIECTVSPDSQIARRALSHPPRPRMLVHNTATRSHTSNVCPHTPHDAHRCSADHSTPFSLAHPLSARTAAPLSPSPSPSRHSTRRRDSVSRDA
jgi:hypothetical protein